MKALIFVPFVLFAATALASHPHDRVCIGSAKIAGQEPIKFIFQWEIERLYERGSPNADTHQLSLEARSCFSDYIIESCIIAKDSKILPPTDNSRSVLIKLKNAKGAVFFEGKFSWNPEEKLVGKVNVNVGLDKTSSEKVIMADATVSLECVSQPKVNFIPAKE